MRHYGGALSLPGQVESTSRLYPGALPLRAPAPCIKRKPAKSRLIVECSTSSPGASEVREQQFIIRAHANLRQRALATPHYPFMSPTYGFFNCLPELLGAGFTNFALGLAVACRAPKTAGSRISVRGSTS